MKISKFQLMRFFYIGSSSICSTTWRRIDNDIIAFIEKEKEGCSA